MPLLQPGDLVRFVSPASSPESDAIDRRAEILRNWSLRVDIAPHAFDKVGYLAGTDEARLADLTEAFSIPKCARFLRREAARGPTALLIACLSTQSRVTVSR